MNFLFLCVHVVTPGVLRHVIKTQKNSQKYFKLQDCLSEQKGFLRRINKVNIFCAGSKKDIEILLENGANVNKANKFGTTALIAAVKKGIIQNQTTGFVE